MLVFCFALFFIMVAACLVTGLSVAWALMGGLALFWLLGLKKGFTNRQLWDMAWAKCKKSLIVVTVIFLIGIITGVWRSSGTIAYCIVMGMKLVTPGLFLVIAFLMCAALSYVLGTSFGVCSTMGVIFMALARSGGVDPTITAGVILSGVYFGDRCSPASSAASLVAAVTGTDLYTNVKQMMKTGLLPTVLTLLIYLLLSRRNPITEVDETVLSALAENFTISWTALLPAAVMFLLPLLRVPIKTTMCASIAVAAVLSVTVQGFSVGDLLSIIWGGYHPADAELARTLSGGGIVSMTSSYVLVTVTGLYSGILEGTGSLTAMDRKASQLAGKIGRFPAMILVSTLCASVLCNQAVTSMLSHQLMDSNYRNKEELALDIENSGIMIAGLIPWCIACSVPLSMLGANAAAVPYGCLLWLTPLCYLFTKKFFYPTTTRPTER